VNIPDIMTSPESPIPPRSPGFYLFRSNSAIPPPLTPPPREDSFLHDIFPHLTRQLIHSVTSILLPVILLPFHFFFLFLSIITTLLAGSCLLWRAFIVYVSIGMDTFWQVYSDAVGGRSGKRRRELLRRVVMEREEAVRAEQKPITRNRGLTLA
jgi:hypothetical protein